jgi:hypothetical protein
VEELLTLAKENSVELTEEEAKDYFNQLNPKSGEISDEELENVSGGACTDQYYNGRLVVGRNNICNFFRCNKCNSVEYDHMLWVDNYSCKGCKSPAGCESCVYVKDDYYYLCTHPSNKKN